jgi:DNA-directed RNA polymerase subunit beta'
VFESGNVTSSLSDRVLGRCPAVDVNLNEGEIILQKGNIIEEKDIEKIKLFDLKSMKIRSVLTCETSEGICAKCYGRDLARGTPVNIGEAVGIIAAQSIGEPGTQLTMRTFHIGGAVSASIEQSSASSPIEGHVKIENLKFINDINDNKILLTRNAKIKIILNDEEKFSFNVPYGSRIMFHNEEKVKANQLLADWDPFTLPIIAERNGYIKFEDLKQGISFRETIDDTTGISSKIITDWSQSIKNKNLKPSISIVDSKGEDLTSEIGIKLNYPMSIDTVLSVEDNNEVKAGQIIARIPKESSKTKDITGGLPRVAELFEARKPKDPAIMSEIDGKISFGKDYKNKRRLIIKSLDEIVDVEILIPRSKYLNVTEGDFVKKGDILVDGTAVPHDILRILGIEQLARYLVAEVQSVYRLQGVFINDKHIEVIARQMLQKVLVKDPGDSSLLAGEQIHRNEWISMNKSLENEGKKPIKTEPILLGITKASLQTRSFISAASFQETTRILTDASIKGKADPLEGLKENVPAGINPPTITFSFKPSNGSALPLIDASVKILVVS